MAAVCCSCFDCRLQSCRVNFLENGSQNVCPNATGHYTLASDNLVIVTTYNFYDVAASHVRAAGRRP